MEATVATGRKEWTYRKKLQFSKGTNKLAAHTTSLGWDADSSGAGTCSSGMGVMDAVMITVRLQS